jgi:hypothetical protein
VNPEVSEISKELVVMINGWWDVTDAVLMVVRWPLVDLLIIFSFGQIYSIFNGVDLKLLRFTVYRFLFNGISREFPAMIILSF